MQALGDCIHHICHLEILFSGNTSRVGASGRADARVRNTGRRVVQALGDKCDVYSLFQDSDQEVVSLGELMQESGVPVIEYTT